MTCPACGATNRDGARFCDSCGAALASAPAREVRKVVTVLFCDIAGYTAAGERLDPEALRKLQSRYFDDARAALEHHGASVEKFIGDAVMAVFGIPQVHEDDALRAARAAIELREAVAALGLQARIGINTGEVVAGAGEALVTGDAVNVAARLEQAAEPGVILIGDATHRLLSGAVTSELAGPLEAKGKSEPLHAWRLLQVRTDAEAVPRRLHSPMVGRERERALLRQAFDRAVEERRCHLFTVLGPAGVGKSRLVTEVASEVRREATVVHGRCLPYGDGITYWPLYEILDEIGGERCRDVREGLEGGASTPEELFFEVRKVLEELARQEPLVVVLDDVHWAEPTFLDFVDHVSDWSRDAPILLVCLARPELLDERPTWGGGKLNATSVLLEPLPSSECELLIRNLLSEGELAAGARRRILEAADGNPLFVEEMLEMLIDDGLLDRRNGSWVVSTNLHDLAVPPTIQALLAARLDRLPEGERAVAERAAVEGKVFHRGAVAQLTPESLKREVGAHLLALVRKELVRPDEGAFADEDAFRFRHLLVRDAAYESLPKEARADLHERFADWLDAKVGEEHPEYEEILGYHLEQAHRCRVDLGTSPGKLEELGQRAAARLGAAGLRALERADAHAASSLLERAVSLSPPGSAGRLNLLPSLGEALMQIGDLQRAASVLEEAIAGARASGDRATESYARLYLSGLVAQTDPDCRYEDTTAVAEAAVASFEELGDHLGAARAWQFVSLFHFWDGQCAKAEAAYERSVEHAQRGGGRLARSVPWWVLGALAMGPTRVDIAEQRCVELEERAGGDRSIEAMSLNVRGMCAAMAGRVNEGRALRDRGKKVYEELGQRLHLAGILVLGGYIDMLAGDAAAAEREYRQGYDLSVAVGETGYRSTLACGVGESLYQQGRLDEAFGLSEESERLGAPDDVLTQVDWRVLRAKVLGRRGQCDDAERLAREAVELAQATDYVDETANALAALAEVLELSGKVDEARIAREQAVPLYEQKGNVVRARLIRERLDELERE